MGEFCGLIFYKGMDFSYMLLLITIANHITKKNNNIYLNKVHLHDNNIDRLGRAIYRCQVTDTNHNLIKLLYIKQHIVKG